MTFVDPPTPPEPKQSLRAADLKGKFVVLRPTGVDVYPEKKVEVDGKTETWKETPYVECDVWCFDRAGVTEEAAGVRITWWRAVRQLEGQIGRYVGAKIVEPDRSVVLVPLEGDAREVASKIIAELEANPEPSVDSEPEYEPGQEPF